jgi:hypothetical protein
MMAGEDSRELSVKVSAGQRRLVSMGFWQAGNGPFGMERLLVNEKGEPKLAEREGFYCRRYLQVSMNTTLPR